MKVWVVSSGCSYEGGGVDAICATRERAIEEALRLNEKEDALWNDSRGDGDPDDGYELAWTMVSDQEWKKNHDYRVVDETEVLL